MKKMLICLSVFLMLVLTSVAPLSVASSDEGTQGSSQVKLHLLYAHLVCSIWADSEEEMEGRVYINKYYFVQDPDRDASDWTVRCPSGTSLQVEIWYETERMGYGPPITKSSHAKFSLLVNGEEIWKVEKNFGRVNGGVGIPAYPSFQVTESGNYEVTVKVECEFADSVDVKSDSASLSKTVHIIIDDESPPINVAHADLKVWAGIIDGASADLYIINQPENSITVKGGTILTVTGTGIGHIGLGRFLTFLFPFDKPGFRIGVERGDFSASDSKLFYLAKVRKGPIFASLKITFTAPAKDGEYKYTISGYAWGIDAWAEDSEVLTVIVNNNPSNSNPSMPSLPYAPPVPKDQPKSQPKDAPPVTIEPAPPVDAPPVDAPPEPKDQPKSQPKDTPKSQPKNSPPKVQIVSITPTYATVNEGDTVDFTVQVTGGSGNFYYLFYGGDGGSRSGYMGYTATISYTYNSNGTFYPDIEVHDLDENRYDASYDFAVVTVCSANDGSSNLI